MDSNRRGIMDPLSNERMHPDLRYVWSHFHPPQGFRCLMASRQRFVLCQTIRIPRWRRSVIRQTPRRQAVIHSIPKFVPQGMFCVWRFGDRAHELLLDPRSLTIRRSRRGVFPELIRQRRADAVQPAELEFGTVGRHLRGDRSCLPVTRIRCEWSLGIDPM